MRTLGRLAAARLLGPRHPRIHPRTLHSSARALCPAPIPVPATPAPPSRTPTLDSPLPITPLCPPASCPCESAPPDLDIDRVTPLAGTMAAYYRHLLISTAKSDWTSKIEFDPHPDSLGGLAAKVKAISSQKGANLRDPFAPTLITNSSFSPEGAEASAYVFPSNLYIPRIPTTTEEVTTLIRDFLLPPNPFTTATLGTRFEGIRRVRETVVLICSHTSRDMRCGVLAPLLKSQFEKVLLERGMLLTAEDEARGEYEGRVRVGFTSHLSGHKFAGNVIVYLPPLLEEGGSGAGLGVWYGRVEPRHVEGIVEETVRGRRVVGELCRGVVGGRDEEGVEI